MSGVVPVYLLQMIDIDLLDGHWGTLPQGSHYRSQVSEGIVIVEVRQSRSVAELVQQDRTQIKVMSRAPDARRSPPTRNTEVGKRQRDTAKSTGCSPSAGIPGYPQSPDLPDHPAQSGHSLSTDCSQGPTLPGWPDCPTRGGCSPSAGCSQGPTPRDSSDCPAQPGCSPSTESHPGATLLSPVEGRTAWDTRAVRIWLFNLISIWVVARSRSPNIRGPAPVPSLATPHCTDTCGRQARDKG